MISGNFCDLRQFGTRRCILTTFGHISEKRTRSQPWLLDIEDCTNQPSEDGVIEDREESKRGRKMKKLHFRRFFRPTTNTKGGSTAEASPEHHHRGRRFPCTSYAYVCHRSHTHSSTHMSTHPSTNPYFPPLHIYLCEWLSLLLKLRKIAAAMTTLAATHEERISF